MTEPTVWSEIGLATFAGVLRARAAERPEQAAFTFLADGESEAGRLTYADLDRAASAIAAVLRESVPAGERVLLLYPPGLDFIAAFFGCLVAGVVAVPAYPPRPNDRSQSRLRAIVRDAAPRAALTTASILSGVEGPRGLLSMAPELAALRWIPTDGLDSSFAPAKPFPEPDSEAVAFLQYTSGSTAEPKGVMVTHANLLHNERMISEAFGMDEDSVVVGWLPLYHDMGLIGNVLQPLYAGARCVLMSPVSFLQRPLRWLEAISRWRATTSGGPNFAYELCLRKASPQALAGLDLTSWRVAFNGAEPVRAATLERFAGTFAPYGFRPEAFYPCYGLAEATLFVSGGERGRRPRTAAFEPPRRVVSCGHAWMGQRLAIADPDTGLELPPGAVGEIWISGPSVARGYWGNEEATERDFNAYLLAPQGPADGPFLRTGDLGFVSEGELYVTGRLKDLVILRGRNHYPQDLELAAEASHPDLRPGGGAAFSVEIEGEERLVIVHEVERRRRTGCEEIVEAVRQAVAAEHEVQVHEVVLIRQGGLPKTSSGKVQRRLCKKLYLADELPVVSRSALAVAERAEPGLVLTRSGLAAMEPAERRARLTEWLRERVAAVLGVSASEVSSRKPLTALGLDSLTAVELKGSVEEALGLAAPLLELLQGIGVEPLADLLLVGLEREAVSDAPPPRALSLTGDQPLSPGQKALWFLERLAPAAGAYNVAVAARVRHGLDAEALRRALAALAARHQALRTVFRATDGEPVQRTVAALKPDVAVEDARSWDEAELRRRLEAEAWRPFDLETGPPLRVRIYEHEGGERALLFAVHHLVCDFWSLAVAARQLAALYLRESGGPRAELAPQGLQYADFVHWQADLLAGPRGERLWDYWREELAGVRDLDLPVDRPRPPVQTWRGLARTLSLPADLAGDLQGLAASCGTTLFTVLLAAFQTQLGRCSGQDGFAVGSPTSGRGAPEWTDVVGYFVNPVALRAELAEDPPFRILLDRVRRTTVAALEHADFPLMVLAERLRPLREAARPPLFQVMLSLQQRRAGDDPGLPAFALGEDGARIRLGGLELESIGLQERRAQFDLILRAAELPGGGLLASLEYNAHLFDPATAERALGRFRALLAAAVADPEARLSELPWMDEAERRQVLDWSAGPLADEPDRPVHELVFEWAERLPEAPAVVSAAGTLTYRELVARARRLARALGERGVGPETVVGLYAERSPELVTGLLGVLAAGGAWLPLDPALPAERLAAMIEDAAAPVVLAQRRHLGGLGTSGVRLIALEDALEGPERRDLPSIGGGHLAYVIFTSGSTGRPKGVAVPHRAVTNRLLRAREAFGIAPGDAMLQRAPVGFDVSVWEILGPLVSGGSVVVPSPEGPRDPAYLARLIAERRITLANFTPSALDAFLDQEGLAERTASLRQVFVGAEALTGTLVGRFAARVAAPLANMYGPTEAAIDLVWHRCRTGEEGKAIPIGRPIAGCAAYVLDPALAPLPAGLPGELWLGGIALARGYAGQPVLTADAFRPSPFGGGERLYCTGDRVRWRPDGELEFLGRMDEQVKIRGVRVEPGDVEAALRRLAGVREAAVVAAGGSGGPRLVAFLVTEKAWGPRRDLRSSLREILPEALVPSAFSVVDELPRTSSGKVDRRALAERAAAVVARAENYVPPRTPVEEILVAIWTELLNGAQVGLHDNFFDLGGHSLLAIRLASRIARAFGVDLPLEDVFTHPTVAAQAERIAAASGALSAPPLRLVPRAAGEELPLSFAQRRLWFLDRLEPGSPVYHLPGVVRLSGPLDLAAVEASLAEIVRRHEVLRTVFRQRDDEPMQVAAGAGVSLPKVDLSSLPAEATAGEAERLGRAVAVAPFDLARGPLWRALALRLAPQQHALALALHHIVADGWSLGILLSELAAFYEAIADGRPSPLPELPVQYADWSLWQRERLEDGVLEEQLAWWRERLADVPNLELPADRPRPAARTSRGGTRVASLPGLQTAAVERLARREEVTPFMVLLAALQAQLARYTGAPSIPVGSPVANRGHAEIEGLIGFFVNMLVLRAPVAGDPPFRDLLARVREVCLGAYARQEVPFERLVEELRPERLRTRNPLFQVAFQLEEPLAMRRLGAAAAEVRRVDTGTAKFDLLLSVVREPQGFAVTLEYDADLFDLSTADRLLGHWRTLVEGIAANPEVRLSELPLLTSMEVGQLRSWSGDSTEYPRQATLQDLFAEQARRTPDAVALEIGEERISYAELEERSDRLATHLNRLGVGLESRVGLCARRSAALVTGMLGILKAGGAYVPLDPGYPAERLAFMAEDSALAALVVQETVAGEAPFPDYLAAVIVGDDGELIGEAAVGPPPTLPVGAENLAYVMYTSGSTGRPKGVEVTHRGVVRLVRGTDYARFGPDEVYLLLSPTSFDTSTYEVWGALLHGARLAVFPGRVESLAELAATISRHGVTTLWLTAGLFHPMVESRVEALRGLTQLLAGGDVLSGPHVRRALAALPGCTVIDGYGPTENTTFTTCHAMRDPAAVGETVPIGRPVANTTVHLLDGNLRPVPVGVPGELYTGGDGLARGYRGRPDLTAERFVPNPFSLSAGGGERLYRTGDLARWRPDGVLEFLGRRDQQVKIRGFRVELGEIEAAVLRHPEVADAAVVAREEPGGKVLVAYVVPRRGPTLPADLRGSLRESLPEFMLPAHLVALTELPLNANGKVDRRALAERGPLPAGAGAPQPAAPRNEIEERLAAIWREVLGVERVGVDDDFFSLGGHSLLAIRVLTRISEAFGTDLPLSDLFAAPTVAELARRLDGPGAQAVAPEPAAGEPPRLSLAQQRLWLLDVLEPGSAKYNVPVAVRLRGTLEVDILVRTLAEIVRRHEPLRTVYAQAEGEPVQVVLPPPGEDGLDFSRLDLRDLSPGLRERAWPEALRDAAARPFDLARGPVVVFFLLELGAEDRVLLALFHHIATDGWSMSVFFRELAVLYGDLAAGRGPSLPEPPLRYVSWANWQRRALEEGSLDAQLSYWRSELAGVPVLELAADRPRSAAAGDRGASRAVAFPDEAIGRLRGLALDRGITPFNLLLAGFATLLSRLSGQRDFAVGLTAAGRKRLHVEELIGFFVNTLAARIRVEDDPAFGSLVARIRDTVLAAQTHQDVPFERVVEDLQPERTVGTSPLFQVAFTYLASPLAPISMPGLTLTLVDVEATTSKFDLTLSVYEEERGLRGWVEYRSGLFDPATIERWMGNLRTLLEGAAVDPSRPLSALPLLSAGERQQLLREWAGEAPEPAGAAGRGIEEWIAAQARRTPEAVAVVQGERELTYGQLVAGAARLTQVLRVRGVGPEVAVGIHLRKSPEAVLAILAVLRAGGAYLPLDPAYPEERLAWLRADARVPLVVDEALLTAAASAFPAAAGREDGAPPACPAYLLYTSGSTGRPKGVVVTRAALLASTRARLEGYTGRVSAFLLLPSLAFDSSVAGLFWTLCQGGTLVLPEEGEERDPARLARLIERRRVSHWLSIPFLYDLVIDAAEPGQLRSLTAVIVAGEPAPADLPRRHAALLPGVPLLNEYGPTEGTVWAAAGELAAGERITIGRPIAGARVLLLDRTMRPVPAGVPAELFLGCEGLARGYFGRPDLTAERFVPAPDGAPGARLYRTGDLARWLPDGRLDLLGRADEQAKIRGFRIEPAEIEAALERCPAVRQAVVVVRDLAAGDRRLVGFVVAAEDLDLGALRQQLADRLPPHMVPAELAVLEALPLLPNGKVDRGALRGLAATRVGSQETAPPAGDLERRLAAIWEELLEVPAVGRDDSFFALGGHSLNAIRLVSRVRTALGVELPVSAVFEAPTLAAMARRLARALGKLETPAAPPIVALPRSSEGEPLSFSQQRLWFLHQLEPGATYHVPGALRVRGALREDVLERTLAEIVRRHEALRTVFRNVASAPVQIVLPPAGLRLPVADLTSLPAEEREAEAGRLLAREARRSFDLETGPLVRALLIRLADDERLLTVVTHHIASDAWSLGVLLRELGEIYSAFVAGKPSQLPALPVQYPDFARWQRSWLSGQVLERELAHWRRVLAGAPESLGLPYDRLPSAAAKARGGRRTFALSADLWQRLLELARREGWTPFMALLAGFQALFSRYGDQEDVVVGSPIANRNWLEFEGLIGFFTNTLALRLDLAGDPSFRELGRRVRAVALETYAHQDLPFEKVVEELAPDRHPSRNPLFQTVLVLEKPPVPPALPGVTCELSDVDTGTAKFDLTLMLTEGEDGAAGWMEYARDLFDGATVDRILGHLRTLLAAAVADPERRLADLPLLTDEESAQLLVKWKQDRADWPTDMLLHELFEAQARRTPEATAVIGPEERLSYGELAARVDRTARRLRALGVGPEIPVGVFLRRTERLVVSLLGILKAGGAYVPLDPAYPAERIDAILGDVRAPLVITEEALLDALPAHLNAGIVRADEEGPADLPVLEPPAVREGRLAYVIYTSGSMGRPKGVAIEHRSAAALMHWSRDSFTPQELAGVLASTSISFDMSVFELFATLSWGGTVILADNALALAELPARGEVTLIDTVPAAMTELLRQGAVPASVRTVNLGGEPLRGALARQIHGLGTVKRLLNLYGPSEDTTFSTVAEVGAEGEPAIGRVLPNAWGYVLDNRLRPVPVGVAGELYLGGVGLSRGYLGRPELTAERYVPDPFSASPGERLYKTGDLVRYRPDGELDYLGRLDHQVKVRGFRVELGEIEVALQGHPALRDAAVLAVGEGGERRLVAYLVARPGEPAPSFTELRSYLKEKLPAYMLPSATVVLEALPLTPNGKLDRRALARIEAERTLEEEGHAAPLTPLESGLAEIWNEVLGRPPAAAGEDFFQLGGHSLLAAQVASRIRETFGVDLPLRRLFEASTLAAMARAVLDAGDRGSPSPPIGPVPRNGDLPLSFSQERLWFLHRLQPESSAYNIPLALRVEGHLDPHRLAAALSAVARRHEVLRTVFAERDGGPIQIVLSPSDIALPAVDLRGLPLAAREEEARRLTAEEAMRPFDLARGPLLRCVLLELALEQAVLVLNLHHIVTDGWSMGVLVRELNALYAGSSLPELPVQYADFAAWQRRWLAGETLDRQMAWWRERLHGAPSALELPADHARPPVLSQRGAEHRFALSGELSRSIAELARRESVTPFMVLAAGLFALLSRLTGQRDLTIGSPMAGRNHLETEGLIGFFVNTLVLRAHLDRTASFRDLLRQVREASLGAYAHQDLPFEKLVDELHPKRDLSRSPLFQVALALQNAPLPAADLGGVRLAPEEIFAGVAKFDLSFIFMEAADGHLTGLLEYATDLFDPATAARYSRHLTVLLGELVARPRGRWSETPLLAAAERQQLLREWNDTRTEVAREVTIHRRFEERADLQPQALAAVWEGERLTYGGLEAKANRLAWLLRDLGAGPGTPVGVWLERSLDMVVAVLGILKAGGHYLPLDVSWPTERAEAILAASRAPIVVTRSGLLPRVLEAQWRLPLADVVCLDVDAPRPPAEPVDAGEVSTLWDFVAERAVDQVSAGGFVSSYTGLPFSEAEVDEYRDRVLSLAAPWLRPDARVLEIGCGSGLVLWELAPRVAWAVGLDPSGLTQERNRAYAAERGFTHVELRTGFAHEIDDLPAAAFDLVVLASTVQFFPGPLYLERIVEKALRRLVPGGALLIADVPDARRRREFQESLSAAPHAATGPIEWFDEDLFRDLSAALPEAAEASILHRREGFANELRFRYDVLLTRGDGERAAEPRRKRLWTGWHVERCSAERPPAAASPDDVAYVIHTSGSTGEPKGIGVQHRPAVGLIDWVNGTFGVGPGDRLLFTTSLGFDLSVYDIFGTLAAGGTIHVAPEAALRDPVLLAAMLRDEPVTLWDSAPAALQQLAPLFPTDGGAGRRWRPLRLVLLSGDWIPVPLPDQVRTAFPGARVVSLGGATEATVWSNWYPIGEVDPRWTSIPYGRPIADARYYVLDAALSPCPVGVPGDLYIGGDVLCMGYVYQPDLTAAQFLPDPFAAASRRGARMYHTGDRARYGADGNLEFLGRVDYQVKIRGYRIELGEIEVALSRHPGVREAIVLAREDVPGDKRLVGYIVPARQPAPTAAELREFLLASLPEYMVPWAFVELQAFPVTTNGKLDRAALPAPQASPSAVGGAYVAPRNELERSIARVWREVLGVERVGVNDNFFESGGSSLLIVKLHTRLKEALGRDVPVMELFRHTTIDALARKLAEENETPPAVEETAGRRARTRQESLRHLQEVRAGRRGGRV